METQQSRRIRFNTIVFVLAAAPFLIFPLIAQDDLLLRFMPDDSFYYIKTAMNFAHHGKVSFDGIHNTNGFHPLYFLLLLPVVMMFESATVLKAIFVLHGLLLFSATLLLANKLKDGPLAQFARSTTILFAASPLATLFIWVSVGLESALVVLCTVLLFVSWLHAAKQHYSSTPANTAIGIAIALLLLSRLDLIIAVIPACTYLFVTSIRKTHRLRHLMAFFAPALVFCSIYLLINLANTGHFTPISGHVKHTVNIPFYQSWISITRGDIKGIVLTVFPFVLGITALFLAGHAVLNKKADHWSAPVIMLITGQFLYLLYLLIYASDFYRWYLSFPIACGIISLAFITAKASSKIQIRHGKTLGATFIGFAVLIAAANIVLLNYIGKNNISSSYHLSLIAKHMNKLLTSSDKIGVYDAGVIGFYFNDTIVNLDGLANNHEYFDSHYRTKKFLEYFQKENISYFLVRDSLIADRENVLADTYESSYFLPDKRIIFHKKNELMRYQIPEKFMVLLFRIDDK